MSFLEHQHFFKKSVDLHHYDKPSICLCFRSIGVKYHWDCSGRFDASLRFVRGVGTKIATIPKIYIAIYQYLRQKWIVSCPHSTPLECGSFNERFSIDIALRWSAETYLSAKKATNTLHPQLKYLHDIKDFRKNLKVFLFITSLNITDQNTLFIRHLFNANSDNWRRY